MRALAGGLTITPGSASGFAPWYASNRETSFRDAATIQPVAPSSRQVKKSRTAAPEGALTAGH